MRILRLTLLLVALVAARIAAASSSSGVENRVDAYIRDEMGKRHIPGLALAVIRQGHIEKLSTYGYANAEFSVPVAAATRFQIASMTKEFTSVALMMLVESDKLKLDDTIGTHLENLPASWRKLTIRQLLNHTTGLPDIINKASEALADTPDEAIKLLGKKPMEFAPGTRWAYNQTNYLLLQLLIEKLSGESFEHFCLEKLFAPLNLSSAAFGGAAFVPDRATLYTKVRIGSDPPEILDPIEDYAFSLRPMGYSAGGLNISIEDFSQWLIALLDGKLISKASLEELWAPTKLVNGTTVDMYGLGWWLGSQPLHPAVGGNGGGRGSFFVYRKDDLAVIVLTNLIGSDTPSLVDAVAKEYLTASQVSEAGAGERVPAPSPQREARSVLAHPVFSQRYACIEHGADSLKWDLGDALGTDCFIEELVDAGGHTWPRAYKGTGVKNEDWYGWRQDVLSPCACKVTEIIVNPVTNQPGVMAMDQASKMVLRRTDGVAFVVVHFDNPRVKVGDAVTDGQPIAQVGNNGRSHHPHIHIGAFQGSKPLQIRFDQRFIQ